MMADRNENSGSYGSSLMVFLLGAAVGATVAILYAPTSGAETRAQLADKAGTIKDKASGLKDQVVETASHWKEVATEKLSTLAHNAKDVAGETARAASDGVSQAADAVRG